MIVVAARDRSADGRGPSAPNPGGTGDAGVRGRRIQGVVLCGGQSRRMGRDKALVSWGDESLLRTATDTLRAVTPAVFLATGEGVRYGELGLETVLDRAPGLGPLAGLEAALEKLVRDDGELLCVLACDMPFAEARLFELLVRRIEERGLDALLLRQEERLEPLCAVYRSTTLPAVRRALDEGRRALRSFHAEVRVETVAPDELSPGLERATVNLNTPADLAEARDLGDAPRRL